MYSVKKKIIGLLFLISGFILRSQDCTSINYPIDGSADIAVDATITWPAVAGVNGYLLSLGTSPGGTDILERRAIGVDNFYKAPVGLPENTQIYASLSILLFNAQPALCSQISFRTEDVTTAPPCTILLAPDNNASNVTIVTDIIWAYATTATGYSLSIGTAPGGKDILNDSDVGNVLLYELKEDLPQDTQIYVTVVPYNENGNMGVCTEESFKTGPAPFACDPQINELTAETIYLRPQIDFPAVAGLCSNDLPYIIDTDAVADGFRWYKANIGSNETLISESSEAPINEPGRYRFEAYNNILQSNGSFVECTSSQVFTIVTSVMATIEKIDVVFQNGRKTITINASGNGEYEYSLGNVDGPYQDSPIFENINLTPPIAYVRDKNGCGISQRTIDRDLTDKDFPIFFTPNGDGVNDFWQYRPPPENFEESLEVIWVFDRYGSLLSQVDPKSTGWNGTFNGNPLPSSNYWFKAVYFDKREITGHFVLKR